MIQPPRVPPGATIGVVTVATPAEARGQVERGIEWWESHGYRVKLGRSTQERGGDFGRRSGALRPACRARCRVGQLADQHGDDRATIPLGVQATLDADARMLTIDEPALAAA